MVKHITGVAVLTVLLAAPVAAADSADRQDSTRRPAVAARLMKARVMTGIRSGALTRAEVSRMRLTLGTVRAQAQAARSDGRVTAEERQTLRTAWRGARRILYRLKHNGVRRSEPSAISGSGGHHSLRSWIHRD